METTSPDLCTNTAGAKDIAAANVESRLQQIKAPHLILSREMKLLNEQEECVHMKR